MAAVCAQPDPPWSAVVDAHDRVHGAIVAAARQPADRARVRRARGGDAAVRHPARPRWSLERMAEHHERLLADLEREGPEPLRAHLAEGRASIAP